MSPALDTVASQFDGLGQTRPNTQETIDHDNRITGDRIARDNNSGANNILTTENGTNVAATVEDVEYKSTQYMNALKSGNENSITLAERSATHIGDMFKG